MLARIRSSQIKLKRMADQPDRLDRNGMAEQGDKTRHFKSEVSQLPFCH